MGFCDFYSSVDQIPAGWFLPESVSCSDGGHVSALRNLLPRYIIRINYRRQHRLGSVELMALTSLHVSQHCCNILGNIAYTHSHNETMTFAQSSLKHSNDQVIFSSHVRNLANVLESNGIVPVSM